MRKLSGIIGIILTIMMLWTSSVSGVYADVWEFGTEGKGKNPFTPRGYLVETEKGTHWLSSKYDNSGFYVRYSGNKNGIDYLDAEKKDGSGYTFYAMTDRNPWPNKSGWVGSGKKFLFAYKDGSRISNFNDYVKTPPYRSRTVDPSGQGTCYVFEIEGFKLEPGSVYQFGFLRGMQANNGITLVLAENENKHAVGYIQQTSDGLTSEEKAKYDREKNSEYKFISSWYKRDDGDGYNVNTVQMRFTVQTYADLTEWEEAADEAQTWLDSVTEKDFKTGKYKRENVEQLKLLLKSLNEKAKEEVKYLTKNPANAKINSMKQELYDMLEKAKSEKPEPSDLKKLQAKIKEAEELYAHASANVGIDIGQYGQLEVENLREEIDRAKEIDKFFPQNEVDNEVNALENAIEEVLGSKVLKEMLRFYDKVTGIYVTAEVDSLPTDTTMEVRVMGKETDAFKRAKKNLSKEETEAVYYDMSFYDDDIEVQPTEKVTVQMPIPDNIGGTSSVYSVSKGGGLTKMNTVKANGEMVFKTGKLGGFMLAGKTASEEEKANARGERMKTLLAQKKAMDAENKDTRLEKEKKKKEEFKDPLNKIVKRNANTATFSKDVRRETNPKILIGAAALLAAVAVWIGIRGILELRRRKRENEV